MNFVRCTQTHEFELELTSEESTWVLDLSLVTIKFYLFIYFTENLYISLSETTEIMLLLNKFGASCKHSRESWTSWAG